MQVCSALMVAKRKTRDDTNVTLFHMPTDRCQFVANRKLFAYISLLPRALNSLQVSVSR